MSPVSIYCLLTCCVCSMNNERRSRVGMDAFSDHYATLFLLFKCIFYFGERLEKEAIQKRKQSSNTLVDKAGF